MMYFIVGGDGREYGPATAEQIRGWIAAGRANLETKARAEESPEWRTLGDFADFSGRVPPPIAGAAPPVATRAAELRPVGSLVDASLGQRFSAALIDGVLKAVCWLPTMLAIGRRMAEEFSSGGQPSVEAMMTTMNEAMLKSLPLLVVLLLVQCTLLSLRGQSVGKLLIGLRIVRVADNRQAGFLHAFFLRGTIPWVIEQIPILGSLFWLVDVMFIFGEERRCVHDLMAGTKVVVASQERAASSR